MKTNSIKNLKFLKLLFIAITLCTFNSISAQLGTGGSGRITVHRGSKIQRFIVDTKSTKPYSLEVYQGDKVVFESHDIYNKSPTVSGLTDTNVMRWAGECIFMENELVQGSPKPFLFFDSNVHGVKKRPYPESWLGGKHLYPEFSNIEGFHKLTWYANGRSELATVLPSTNTYNIDTNLKSYKEDPKGYSNSNKFFPRNYGPVSMSRYQRNNQKEGLNMELLQAHIAGENFVAGLDTDELIYNNLNSSKIVGNLSANFREFYYVHEDNWKWITENQKESINRSMFEFLDKTLNEKGLRNRREIVDDQLYINKVTKTYIEGNIFDNFVSQPLFNNKRPVYYNPVYANKPIIQNKKLYFYVNGKASIINLAVHSILEGKRVLKGPYDVLTDAERQTPKVNFYGIIDGPIHVARFQKGVQYKVRDLPFTTEVTGVFSLVYTYEDSYGIMQEQRKEVDGNDPTAIFDIQGGGYHDLTLRYKADPADNIDAEVIIAGKELIDIDLRFIFAPSNYDNPQKSDYSYNPKVTLKGNVKLNENKGNGKNWFLGDNNTKLKDNDYGLEHGYKDHNVIRTYTLKKDDEMTLTVLDADPHSFVHYQPDFYLSERRLSKRLTNDDLEKTDTQIEWFVSSTPNFSTRKPVGKGRYYTFSPGKAVPIIKSTGGYFYIKAVYNKTSEIAVKIVVSPATLPTIDEIIASTSQNLGNVIAYDLSDDQYELLQKTAPYYYYPGEITNYKIFKVKDILSAYTYGAKLVSQRNAAKRYDNVGEHTRFSDMNNYNNTFRWTTTTKTNTSYFQLHYSFSDSYSYDKYLDQYQKKWFPYYWVRHLDSKEMSTEIPIKDQRIKEFPYEGTSTQSLTTYNKNVPLYEPWQVRLPWISQTAQGYKARWNIKCIYDVEQLFGSIGIPVTTSVSDYSSNVLGTDGSKIIKGFDAKQREMQEFYYMLKNQEIIVVDLMWLNYYANLHGGLSNLKFKVEDSGNKKIYEGNIAQILSGTSQRLAESKKEASLPINDNGALCTVYPNPNSVGIFSIDINVPQENSNVDLQLSDLNGKIIYNSLPKVVNGRYSTTIGENLNLPKGVYLLTIKVNDLIETKKLIVN